MGEVLLLLVVALTVAAVVFGVTVLVSGRDPGLVPVEPDGRAVPLPGGRPLDESDVAEVRFDTALRGYRMAQVDQAMRRAAYDIGYKSELIGVLEAEVAALREGRTEEADALRRAREEAAATSPAEAPTPDTATIELGLAGAPAAAAVEDEASLPTGSGPEPVASAGAEAPVAPVAAPVNPNAQPAGQSSSDPTAAPAGDADAAATPTDDAAGDPAVGPGGNGAAAAADAEEEPTRGAVVRSESA
ncbi:MULTISPECIES: DivIVA domain-containing protein [Micromonospora]|uniref:DivIVA domain-containing protein n=1 Tax=Micromonospora solifontis TaxID=2487138 RepID=A0ABX9WD47_9ACTN|nr:MULTISPECIES: DivIVA domain-containing protein [Micromonospora]NES14144.1 DivIVA domain-containing protein [Micromonospora sp. PPF5-17B]NES37968.1 DivIVA domain-containing protein [Micromonospora solifontis]NES55907.1 DivIVA domain-containing protein [Micromonospora sp. PPF5-6]RNL97727.1 DivIVA domain-containing protein [Micromonospora solifontis]